ncbi:hypothetical protein ACHAPU_010955 [Fusarium lateritium]
MDSTNRNTYRTTGQAAQAVDDAPPPPYSETDIYSTSSQPPQSPSLGSIAGSGHGPAAPGDDVASRMSSTSTTEPVIFTPPLTPRTDSNANVASPISQQHVNIPLSPSVALYFETRPAPVSASQWEPQIHRIAIRPDSVPDDIPYPQNWATSYDITPQDWATFVNFLLPGHDSVRNEEILGEKGSDIKSISGDSSAKSERNTADPHELRRRRAEVEALVQQWNSAFFAPRNVMVRLQPEEQSHMPGGWESTFDDPPVQVPVQAGPSSQREAAPQRAAGSWTGGWGGLKLDNDSIRWGDRFVADGNGLRIGNLVMDSRGIRMGGQGGDPFVPGHAQPQPPNARNMPPFGPGNFPWQPAHPEAHPIPGPHRGRALHHERAPHHERQGPRSRSSSTSSSSSSSSSSSCSSASSGSIGSLPDYDDLKDQQLPVYIARLQLWTNNPHEARSKGDVKQLKAELKAHNANTSNHNVDRKALKAQSKVLAQQWRSLKRQQKKERRDRKRGLKKQKKAEKRERRQQKREMKTARRDHRRGERGRGRGHVAPHPAPFVPSFQVPPVHVPPVNVPPFQVPPVHVHVPPVNVPGVGVPPPTFGGWGCPGRGAGRGDRGSRGRSRGRGWGCDGQGPWGRAAGQFHASLPNACATGPVGRGGFSGIRNWPPGHGEGPQGPFPGAWPEDGNRDVDIPPPGAASAAKYDAVAGIETEIARKLKDVDSKQVTMGERRALEKEIEALTETLDRIRLEADEAYAHELAEMHDG